MSLTEDVNTSTPTGMLFFQLIARLSEFEHNLISERTKQAWKQPAPEEEQVQVQPLKADDIKIAIAKQLDALNIPKVTDICRSPAHPQATLYRYLKM